MIRKGQLHGIKRGDIITQNLSLPLFLELLHDDAHQQRTFSLSGILATHPTLLGVTKRASHIGSATPG
jgi:hypothetical protein